MLSDYKKLLSQFVSFKSISTDKSFAEECENCANWLRDQFEENDFDVEVFQDYGNPIVLAEYEVGKDAETVLIYGHYDVQPASMDEGWSADPFELVERDGKFFARGVMDDKGLVLIHMFTLFRLIKEKKLKYNVKFVIEGGEETGSPGIGRFLVEHKGKLEADFILVSDGPQLENLPTLEVSYRGVMNLTLMLETLDSDAHSGQYGGVAPNAAYELSLLLAQLYREGKINMPEMYEDVISIDEAVKLTKGIPFDYENYKKRTGAKAIYWEEGANYYIQKGLRPSIEITGLEAGYSGEGYRNSIPAKTRAKLNFRLVKGQNPEKVLKAFEKFLQGNLSEHVKYTVDVAEGASSGFDVDTDNKYFKQAEKILEEVYKEKSVRNFVGGTIPVIKDFNEIFAKPILSIPLANADSRMHGVDENLSIKKIEKGLEVSTRLLGVSDVLK